MNGLKNLPLWVWWIVVLAGMTTGCSTVPVDQIKREWAHVYEPELLLLKHYQLANAVVFGRHRVEDGKFVLVVDEVWKGSPIGPVTGDKITIGSGPPRVKGNPDPVMVCFLRYDLKTREWRSTTSRWFQSGRIRSHPEFTGRGLKKYYTQHGKDEVLLPALPVVQVLSKKPDGLDLAPGEVFADAIVKVGLDGSVKAVEKVNSISPEWTLEAEKRLRRFAFRPANRGEVRLFSRVKLVFAVSKNGEFIEVASFEHLGVL